MAPPHLTYYSAWFCPFAHRATVALSHHASSVAHTWVESLGWERRASEDANSREQGGEPEHENWYHWKSPELLAANPEGLIPTLVDEQGRAVHESLITVEYVDELAKLHGDPSTLATPLLPGDPAERARCRLAADWVNRNLCSPYYRMLVRTDPTERREAFDGLRRDLAVFAKERKGIFYCGDTLSAADVALLPWACRFYVLEHYRGFVIEDEGDLKGYHEWLRAALALPQVASTLPDKQKYLKHIGRYADASARSKVANAVRSGRAAHDLQRDD